jgi:predicted permease
LAAGASVDEARNDLANIGRQLTAEHPTDYPDFPGFATTVVPVLETIAGSALQSTLWMLLGAVVVVLLVVCANVANLMLARGRARQREFAVRRALGASRGRIARQLVSEGLVLVSAGGGVGVVVALMATPVLASRVTAFVPRMNEIAVDWRVLAFAVAVTVASGLVFALVPAMRLSATQANEALREGGRGTGTARLRSSQGALVLAECALALVLLTGAGLFLKSLSRLNSVDAGFDARNVLTMRLEFAPAAAAPAAPAQANSTEPMKAAARARVQLMADALARIAAVPGVAGAGFIDDMFIAGAGNKSITVPGRVADQTPPGELLDAVVSPGFFEVARVALRRGRYPTLEDANRKILALWPPAGFNNDMSLADKERLAVFEPVVVNESFARRFFPGEDPVGRRFCTDPTNKTSWYEIVGVVGDMHRQGLDRATIPEFYGAYLPNPNGRVDLMVRTDRDPLLLAGAMRAEVARVLPGISIVSVSTLEAGLGQFSAQRRLQAGLLAAFAFLAVALAAVGIFGLAHYAVAERTREIGVRVALGASPGDVLRMLVAQGMRMPLFGIIIGVALSMALTRVVANQLYAVEATDPVTFAAVAGVLALVAALACYLAARRAAAVDPVRALRAD